MDVQSCLCLVFDGSAVIPILWARRQVANISTTFIVVSVLRVYHGDSLFDAQAFEALQNVR